MSNTSSPLGPEPSDSNGPPGGRRFRIEEVRRETGVSKETLRVWERRYAFPRPGRDRAGDRLYTQLEVDKLKLVKRLIDRGHRPSALVTRSGEELSAMLLDAEPHRSHPRDERRIEPLLSTLKAHDISRLQDGLRESMHRQGLELFVIETVAPLTAAVGAKWVIGEIEVYEEHLYSEVIQSILREAMNSLPARDGTPRIVLTTPPGEQHQLGMLMAQVLLALEGAQCIPLGTQTPHRDMVRAAVAHEADVVALSIASSYSLAAAIQVLTDLDGLLPDRVEVWVGGSVASALRDPPNRARLLRSLTDIRPTLQSWRAQRANTSR